MNNAIDINDQPLVSCEICLKSVPKQDSKCVEADEYVAYFCGLDCYDKWVKQDSDKKESERG